MGNYEQLKEAIKAVIKTNGKQEITGQVMQDTLLAITSSFGQGALFAGIATPETNPLTPDQNVFYLAAQSGVYPNFNGLSVNEGEIVVFSLSNGQWTKQILSLGDGGSVTIINEPDEEDLTTVPESPGKNVIRFKNRAYNEANASGKGYKILRKYWKTVDGVRKNILTQDMINDANTIYEIRYDFDLNGAEIQIKEGCVLNFVGGSFNNGKINGNMTKVVGSNYEIFKGGYSYWTSYLLNNSGPFFKENRTEKYIGGIYIKGTWDNSFVGSNWCGLLSVDKNKDCSRRINNHLLLYGENRHKEIPKNEYYIYGTIITNNVSFNNSTLIVIDDYSLVTDETIEIPAGTIRHKLLSNYGQLCVNKDNSYLKDVTVIGNQSKRNETYSDFGSVGVVSLLDITGNSILINNIQLSDCFQCAITTGKVSNLTIDNLLVSNIGEHGLYLHSEDGFVNIFNSTFVNVSSDKSIEEVRGSSAVIKFSDYKDVATYDNTLVFLKNCIINITHDLPNAFCYGNLPHVLKLYGCKFFGNCRELLQQGTFQSKVIFKDCSNVPYIRSETATLYTQGYNTIFKCQPFDIYEAENCIFDIPTSSSVSVLSEDCKNISHVRCKYKQTKIGVSQITLKENIELQITDCTIIDEADDTARNTPFIFCKNLSILKINNCYLKPTYRYLIKTNSNKIYIQGLHIEPTVWNRAVFDIQNCTTLIANDIHAYCDDNLFAAPPIMEDFSIQNINIDYTSNKYNPYYNEHIINVRSGQIVVIPATVYFAKNITNLSDFVKVEPLGNIYNNVTYSVTNATAQNNATIKIEFNDREERTFKVTVDLRMFPNPMNATIIQNYITKGDTNSRPKLQKICSGFQYYDTTLKKYIVWNGTEWVYNNGYSADYITKGMTSERPTLTNADDGFEYYDTILMKKILWNGIAWVNVDGTALR